MMVRLKEEKNAARSDAGGGRNGLNLRRTVPIIKSSKIQQKAGGHGLITHSKVKIEPIRRSFILQSLLDTSSPIYTS